MMNKKVTEMNDAMIERLALAAYALTENHPGFISYEDACDMMNLTQDEKTAVLELIDADLRVV